MKTLRDVNLPKTIVDTIPESVARECSVIAVALSGDVLMIACPDECFDARDEERVRYILNRPLTSSKITRIGELEWRVRKKPAPKTTIRNCGGSLCVSVPLRFNLRLAFMHTDEPDDCKT